MARCGNKRCMVAEKKACRMTIGRAVSVSSPGIAASGVLGNEYCVCTSLRATDNSATIDYFMSMSHFQAHLARVSFYLCCLMRYKRQHQSSSPAEILCVSIPAPGLAQEEAPHEPKHFPSYPGVAQPLIAHCATPRPYNLLPGQ